MGLIKKQTNTPAFEDVSEGDTAVAERPEETQAEVKATPAAPANNAKPRVQPKPAEAVQPAEDAEVKAEEARDEKDEVVKKPEQAAEQPASKPSASRAVSLIKRDENGRPITLLSTAGESTNYLAMLRGAFKEQGLAVSYSTFPRLKLDTGKIATKDGEEAGDWIELQVISHDPSWTVGTGSDAEGDKVHVRFSDDGKTIQASGDDDEYAGMSLEEYRDVLRNKGYEKAAIKEYTIVTGVCLMQQADDFAHADEIVTLSLSPTSKTKFDQYVLSRGVRARMGKVIDKSANPVVRFTSERIKGKERSYFSLKPTDGVAEPVGD